jgi:hypothetical protein
MTRDSAEPIQPSVTGWLWYKCLLPWPGKKSWEDTQITKAVLLGAEFQYAAVSAWDWDEAWVVDVGDDQLIATSSKVACAIAYLKYKGVEV